MTFFSLGTLNISLLCLLVSTFNEKSAVCLSEHPLYMINCFSLATFKVLSFSVFQWLDYNVPRYRFLNLVYLKFTEVFEYLDWCFSSIWREVCQYFFSYSFCHFPSLFLFSHNSACRTSIMHVLICFIISTGLWDW